MWKSRCGESLRACVENRVLEGNTVWKETGLEGREANVERKNKGEKVWRRQMWKEKV